MKHAILALLLTGLALPAAGSDDKEEVKAAVKTFVAAWNKHDAAAMAAVFAKDADLVNPWGQEAQSRTGIEKFFAAEHGGPLKTSVMSMNVKSVRLLDDEVALADIDAEVSGMTAPDGKPAPALKHHVAAVLMEKGEKWEFTSVRAYALMEAPKEAPAATALPPFPENATEKAPESFKARFTTTKGDFVVEVRREWAPLGADRFYNLVKLGYFTDVAFFRVVNGFMVQFGVHGSPEISARWRDARIMDDPLKNQSNKRGMMTYAMGGPNTRTTQIFINFGDNARLDPMGFPPFGQVVQGMDVVDSLYKGYGDGPDQGGNGPNQGLVQMQGNAYLKSQFPLLDYIKSAKLEK